MISTSLLPSTLSSLYLTDAASAAFAALLATPLVAAVDKAIVQLSAGQVASVGASVAASLQSMARNPLKFAARPEFLLVFTVYFLTYLSANFAETYCESADLSPAMPKLAATTVTNVCACITKDALLARIYSGGPARSVPLLTVLLFALRDMMTVAASFTLPPAVSSKLQEKGLAPSPADNAAQVLCPVSVQVLSTPIHLLGLSLYSHPSLTASARASSVAATYKSALAGRAGRILPAFGLGGVGNRMARNKLREAVKRREEAKRK